MLDFNYLLKKFTLSKGQIDKGLKKRGWEVDKGNTSGELTSVTTKRNTKSDEKTSSIVSMTEYTFPNFTWFTFSS